MIKYKPYLIMIGSFVAVVILNQLYAKLSFTLATVFSILLMIIYFILFRLFLNDDKEK
ncbi:hypothetical protein LMG9449_2211 [Lactococcus lactis subsp. lactis]|uniref:Uncharacterized protein n=1 Tax=Lactococcus lactis subsp. lactis TaxID=1360 RepID=A0A0V8DRZ8_LACLL|nr:hypothetical protein LMG9449_2211 [Lactococcus lactis subsp. lactis]KSU16154.1 hypothetical protein LMG9446_0538 [Lactococcus lactis subsp. lactis]